MEGGAEPRRGATRGPTLEGVRPGRRWGQCGDGGTSHVPEASGLSGGRNAHVSSTRLRVRSGHSIEAMTSSWAGHVGYHFPWLLWGAYGAAAVFTAGGVGGNPPSLSARMTFRASNTTKISDTSKIFGHPQHFRAQALQATPVLTCPPFPFAANGLSFQEGSGSS